MIARSREVGHIIKRELKKLNGIGDVEVPHDLENRVREYLIQHPESRWDAAVQQIADGP